MNQVAKTHYLSLAGALIGATTTVPRAWGFTLPGLNSRSTMIHRPGISCLPIRRVRTASSFSSSVRHDASPIGMNLSSDARTPMDPGYVSISDRAMVATWAKYLGIRSNVSGRGHPLSGTRETWMAPNGPEESLV